MGRVDLGATVLVVCRVDGSGLALGVGLQLLFVELREVVDAVDRLKILASLVDVLATLLLEYTRVGKEFVESVFVLHCLVHLALVVSCLQALGLLVLSAFPLHAGELLQLLQVVAVAFASLAKSRQQGFLRQVRGQDLIVGNQFVARQSLLDFAANLKDVLEQALELVLDIGVGWLPQIEKLEVLWKVA